MYRYYKGEKENPFAKILDEHEIENKAKHPPESMRVEYDLPPEQTKKLSRSLLFWEREEMFEKKYKANNFSLEYWCVIDTDKLEWKRVLKFADKKEIFNLWNKESLTQIGDKYQIDFEEMYKLYCNNE
jgi:hypothetical protein